jgi:hypothetical protein
MVLKTRKKPTARYANKTKNKHYAPYKKTMKGGSNNSTSRKTSLLSRLKTFITKKFTDSEICKDITDIFKLAYKLNRHRLVEKIIYNISGGQKYARLFGIKLTGVTKGQQWFKLYGKIDNLVKCLNDYFFNNANDFTNKINAATLEIQTFLTSKDLDGVRHEMRILLLLLLFLTEKLDKIQMNNVFFNNLKKSLEHIENDTGQSKIKRLTHTKLAILYFINQHELLDTVKQTEFNNAVNASQTLQFASKQQTQSIINLLLGALERNQYEKVKIELHRLKAEQETLRYVLQLREDYALTLKELEKLRETNTTSSIYNPLLNN